MDPEPFEGSGRDADELASEGTRDKGGRRWLESLLQSSWEH